MSVLQSRDALYRIDKFAVPEAALLEFLALVNRTHEVLRRQSGFVRDLVLQQVSGPGQFNAVTFVEWADQASYDEAAEAVHRFHGTIGFDAKSAMARLGITADIGIYRQDAAM